MAEPLSASELTVMVIMLAGLPFILRDVRRHRAMWPFLLGYVFFTFGTVATNLEALVFPEAMNFAEHLIGYLGSGVVFAWTARRAGRRIRAIKAAAAAAVKELR